VLRSFATPLPFHDAVRLPLVVLPRAGVQPVNAVQVLQWRLTTLFDGPGWSARTRALAPLLPAHTLRTDLYLFIGAFAPRVLAAQAGADPAQRAQALADAWGDERVQRRWQHLALQLGEAGCADLLRRLPPAAQPRAAAR
jgi:hypothetical protein